MNQKRVRILKEYSMKPGPIIYWMSRDQRVQDNWALLFAQELAIQKKEPLAVVFCLVASFLNATMRQYVFMTKGLEAIEEHLEAKRIPFYLLRGSPTHEIPKFVKKYNIGTLITDFDPLSIKRKWKEDLAKNIRIPFYEVDAHNIVPCWIASTKQEFGAYTLRPKIKRILPDFLEEFSKVTIHPFPWKEKTKKKDWLGALKTLELDRSVEEVFWINPGERAAQDMLRNFLKNKLALYAKTRNDPTYDGQSNLSPYLHFGQLSAQRVAIEVQKSEASKTSKDAFLEELIVRRELSDNFCFYNQNYDSFNGLPNWAKETLNKHQKDKREYIYTDEQLERGETHDDLWNAAQMEMVKTGKMHGYMRMYWGKKILEWTKSTEEALRLAMYLNDRYELDGRDPNGYVGVAWSIGGVHDRAWFERPIFGKVRYMSYNGCKSKFNVASYIQKINTI